MSRQLSEYIKESEFIEKKNDKRFQVCYDVMGRLHENGIL